MKKRMISVILTVVVLFTAAATGLARPAQATTGAFKEVAAGSTFSLALMEDNSLWSWGRNSYGQLGDGTTTHRDYPAKILSNVTAVAAGGSHALAILSGGDLCAWGLNSNGQLGDGTQTTSSMFTSSNQDKSTPVRIMGDVIGVAARGSHSLAVKKDGSLWAWGSVYIPGTGTNKTVLTPMKIMDDVVYCAAGVFCDFVIKSDGSLWGWGANSYGQLGDGTQTFRPESVKIMDNVKTVAAGGDYTIAVKTDGSLWTWGWLLPDDSATRKTSIPDPVKLMDDVVAITAGSDHNLAIRKDGSLWSWGSNSYGELGDGTRTTMGGSHSKAQPVKIMQGVIAAAAGKEFSIAVKEDGSVWTWGNHTPGLGDGSEKLRRLPAKIMGGAAENAGSSGGAQQPSPAVPIRVTLDGLGLDLDQPPIVEKGRTLIPIRAVAESIGADVEWDPVSKTATLSRANTRIVLTIGSNTAYVDGKEVILDAAPVIVNGRTLLPLRFVAEAFSQNVEWDSGQKIVRISEDMSFAADSNMREWLIGAGAIIAQVNAHMGMDPYLFGMMTRTSANVETARNLLASSWGVTSRGDLLLAMSSILHEGHSFSFDYDVALFKSLTPSEQKFILENADGVDKYMWPLVISLDAKWGEKSIRAWDWFRAGHLCRWGYLAGFITMEEAYAMYEPTARKLRATFSSWDEAHENYLDGYAYWGRFDVNDESNDYAKRKDIYERLKRNDATSTRGLLFDPQVWTQPVKGT